MNQICSTRLHYNTGTRTMSEEASTLVILPGPTLRVIRVRSKRMGPRLGPVCNPPGAS